jgi:hypothetical protein
MAKIRDESTKPKGKSKYQKKLARKHGRAAPNPEWMWWMTRGSK